jgi:hypothetical protein
MTSPNQSPARCDRPTQHCRQSSRSLRNAIAFADRAIALAASHGTGVDALAHVVRGRARLSLGDGGGMDELEPGLDEVLRYESGSFAIAARMWFADALHHWRGPAAERKARQELEVLAESRGLQFITSMSIAEEVRVLYELGRFDEAIALAERIHEADVEAQPRRGRAARWPCWTPARSTTRPSRTSAGRRRRTKATCGTSSASRWCAPLRRPAEVTPPRR